MNARGLMILIFINIGLAYDLATPEMFAILVLVAIVTTAAAMPIYRTRPYPTTSKPRPTSNPLRPR